MLVAIEWGVRKVARGDEPGEEIEELRERHSKLSESSLLISESLDVTTVLREIVDSAREQTGAGCSGIKTMDASGQLQDFVTSGLSSEAFRGCLNLPTVRACGSTCARSRSHSRSKTWRLISDRWASPRTRRGRASGGAIDCGGAAQLPLDLPRLDG